MSFGEAWKSWRRGEGWDSTFGYLYLSQEEIDRGRNLDNRLDASNRAAFERGTITQDQFDASSRRLSESQFGNLLTDPNSSIWGGFKEGWQEGADNVQGVIKKGLAAPINFTFGAIPWQVWAAVGVYIAWKLGLLGKLFKR